MAKIRVIDIAKEYSLTTQEVMKKLEGLGIFVAGPDNVLKPEEVVKIKSLITGKKIKLVKKKVVKKEDEAPSAAKADETKKAVKKVKAEEKPEEKAADGPEEVITIKKAVPKETKSAAKSEDALKDEKKGEAAEAPQKSETAAAKERKAEGSAEKKPAAAFEKKSVAKETSREASRETSRESSRPAAREGSRDSSREGARPSGGRGASSASEKRSDQRPAAQRGERKPARGQEGTSAQGARGGSGKGRRSDAFEAPAVSGKSEGQRRGADRQDRSKKDKQKNTGSEDYKNKKNKLIQEASYLDDDRLARHKKKPIKRPAEKAPQAEEEIKIVALPDSMTVKELSDFLHKPINQIIKMLMGKGIMAGLNQIIEFELAEQVAAELDILVEHQEEEDIFQKFTTFEDSEDDLQPRSPVVVVMGHVDHGKTSLLDAIRNTNVTTQEAGGITQHIGASRVAVGDRLITFLDTPGHEAFTAMRMRGAQVTDIAILVVAADDGVMPQTVEAINHAKAAGVQIIVAINKMDKPGANPDRVKQELTEYELIPEDWGGSTICVPVSALNHEGIDNLLEMVLLVADMQELKANPNALASGTVIESELDKGRGAVATVLIQRGTLHVGDTIVAGSTFGRIKAMVDDKGRRVKEAGPSEAVEIIGLNEVPSAGDSFFMTETDKEARSLAEKVSARERIKLIDGNKKVNLDDLFGDIQSGDIKELNILVKADVQGSVEAVRQSLEKLSNEQVKVNVIHGAVGAITESDVMLASASNSIIIGFNVRPDQTAKSMADEQKVDIRLYRVIYNAIDDIEAAMKGMLDPEFQEKILGHATLRQIFHASGVGTIGGAYVTDGKLTRNAQVRVVRDGIVVHEGLLDSLRRFKDDVREVATGYECGVLLEKYNDIKEGDVIEAFVMEEIKRD